MKKFLFASLLAVSSLSLTGCAADPSTLSYGAFPPLDLPKSVAQKYFQETLKDYNSAIITYGGIPHEGYYYNFFGGGTQAVGWHYEVGVNAKNSYGAYTGNQLYVFVFRGKEWKALIAPKVTSSGLRTSVIFDETNGGKRS